MEKSKPEIRLTGRWRLSRRFITDGSEERNLQLFDGDDHIVGFPAEGVITERSGNEVTTSVYSYDPAGRVIIIQQTNRTPASPISGTTDNTFRIIPLNEREMYFQRLDGDFEVILLEKI